MTNKLTTKQRLAKADPTMLSIVRKYLDRYGITVRKWMPYNDRRSSFRNVVYEAYFDAHQVSIPIPIDRYSFYVCMHEIGHLVCGDRMHGYNMEYVAEQWALRKCKQYGCYTKEIEKRAKDYVYQALLEDIVFRIMPMSKIRPDVLTWIGVDDAKVHRDAVKYARKLLERRMPKPNVIAFHRDDVVKKISAFKALVRISLDILTNK